MPFYKYQRITDEFTTYYFKNTENSDCVEVAEIEGYHYVFVPGTVEAPEQHPQITLETVEMTDALRSQIKVSSRQCQLITERMQKMIRDKYSLEDEQYFARIGVGAALGVYQFQEGEQEALMAFGAHVEGVRQWGKVERAKIGL